MCISEPHPVARLIIDITRVNAAIAQDALKSFLVFFSGAKQLEAVPVVL